VSERLYYQDSFLTSFEARVVRAEAGGVVLDRTAFYPASGGQPNDLGRLNGVPVTDVVEDEGGEIVHRLDGPLPASGETLRGEVDWERRRDHMQQHSGQHLLSAAFVRLFGFQTVSFHLGAATCTIDLSTSAVSAEQARRAERLSNEIVFEDRPVRVFLAGAEQARSLDLRKETEREGELRLVEIRDFDLNACGGTHVTSTGQIGVVLLRKIEKSRYGTRVEFVCGLRAARVAGADYATLTEAAAVLSAHADNLPALMARQVEELKAAEKERQKLLQAMAGYEARELYAAAPEKNGVRLLVKTLASGDVSYARSLAAQFAAQPNARAMLLLKQPPTLVLAQSRGLAADLGAAVKKLAAEYGLRGGGSRDSAQAGAPDAAAAQRALDALLAALGQS
jgi:alanyl-tRNA synthetase